MIFKNCLHIGFFPNTWKKSNVVTIHKKDYKQLLQNYRYVSLLPIYGKFFSIIIFKPIFEYLEKNSLLSQNESSFRPFSSCGNHLLSVVHGI